MLSSRSDGLVSLVVLTSRSVVSTTSSAKSKVDKTKAPSRGLSAARYCLVRSTKRPMPTFPVPAIASTEKGVGPGGDVVGDEVVAVLEEKGVDVRQLDELLDVDAAAGLGRQRLELFGLHDHVLASVDLVALHDLGVVDLLARPRSRPSSG